MLGTKMAIARYLEGLQIQHLLVRRLPSSRTRCLFFFFFFFFFFGLGMTLSKLGCRLVFHNNQAYVEVSCEEPFQKL